MITQRNNRGFSLIETMVAIVISSILIAAVSATYIVQNRSYSVQDDVAELNTQTKMAHDIIRRTIKGAPFSYRDNMADNIPAALSGGFSSANIITPTDSTTSTDAITITTALEIGNLWPVGNANNPALPCNNTVHTNVVDPLSVNTLNADLVVSGTVSPVAGSYLIIGGREFAIVQAYNVGTSFITFTESIGQEHNLSDTSDPGDGVCDQGVTVHMLIDTTFCVDGNNNLRRIRLGSIPATCTGSPTGNFNQIIAENIEDLQFAYAVDVAVPLGEIDGSAGMLDNAIFSSGILPINFSRIRAVRINILSATDMTDRNFTGLGNPPSTIENRGYPQTGDNFRRRWMRSIVLMKNLEGVI